MTARLGIVAALAFACLAAPAMAAPGLRSAATVEGPVIRLGDLFADAGPRAADVVAPSPPPGSRTIFDAVWLAATAQEHGLAWQPQSRFDQATIERASRTISLDAITHRLLEEIASREPIGNAEFQLDNPAPRLVVAAEASESIAVEALTIDARTGRVSAFIAAPAGDPAAERQRVSGRLLRMVDLPVLARPIAPGETIAARDIETLRIRADRVTQDGVTDAREMIGKTPRHPLRPHEPLRLADIQVPVIVHKGDLVTILLETPTMRLTAQGKAVEDGGMGAAIRIANTKSNRVIDAMVIGPNLVTVTPAAQLAAR
jgi:flagella basal body P-ring formation protein FlgA